MASLVLSTIPLIVLLSNIALAVLLVSLMFKNSFAVWAGRHSVLLGLLLSIAAVFGSLFYSNVMDYPPCDLCWWQRVFIFPQLILFAVAFKLKDSKVFAYSVWFALLAIVVSIYNIYIQMGGDPLVPCSAVATCDKVYVSAYGYITIPAMALSVSVAFLLLAWARKVYENNSNSR